MVIATAVEVVGEAKEKVAFVEVVVATAAEVEAAAVKAVAGSIKRSSKSG